MSTFKNARIEGTNPRFRSRFMDWPHQRLLSPAVLEAAGFVYRPAVSDHDRVLCTKCQSYINGWENVRNFKERHNSEACSIPKTTPSIGPGEKLTATTNLTLNSQSRSPAIRSISKIIIEGDDPEANHVIGDVQGVISDISRVTSMSFALLQKQASYTRAVDFEKLLEAVVASHYQQLETLGHLLLHSQAMTSQK